MTTLCDLALEVLETKEAAAKAALSRSHAAKWYANRSMDIGHANPPERPARPAKPDLISPTEMPRRRGQSDAARATLLHAVLHIELNAIDLAWDMIARFTAEGFPRRFYDDWVQVADEEGKHFQMLSDRIADFGFSYGDFPAHDGLWEAAWSTRHNVTARLAVVPMVLEARGLDVTPAMIDRFAKMEDFASADILKVILDEEIGHVATGNRWFHYMCLKTNMEAKKHWQKMVRENFRGLLKPPFNEDARRRAGFSPDYYLPLSTPVSRS